MRATAPITRVVWIGEDSRVERDTRRPFPSSREHHRSFYRQLDVFRRTEIHSAFGSRVFVKLTKKLLHGFLGDVPLPGNGQDVLPPNLHISPKGHLLDHGSPVAPNDTAKAPVHATPSSPSIPNTTKLFALRRPASIQRYL